MKMLWYYIIRGKNVFLQIQRIDGTSERAEPHKDGVRVAVDSEMLPVKILEKNNIFVTRHFRS